MRKLALYLGGCSVALPLYFKFFYEPGKWMKLEWEHHRNILFVGMVFLSLIFFGLDRDTWKRHKTFLAASAYFIIAGLINQWNPYSERVVFGWICVSAAFVLTYQLLGRLDYLRDKKTIFNAFSVVGIIQSIWISLSFFGVYPIIYLHKLFGYNVAFGDMSDQFYGSLGNKTLSGVLISVTLPFLLRRRWNLFVPLSVFAIYVCGSTFVSVSALIGCLSYFGFKYLNKRWVYYSAVPFFLTLLAVALAFKGSSYFIDSGRYSVWEDSLQWLSGGSIIWGKGVGYFGDVFSLHHIGPFGKKWIRPHNDYIDLYVAYGLVGFVFFGLIVKPFFMRRTYEDPHLYGCLFALLFDAFGSFPFHMSPIVLIGCISYALLFSQPQLRRN